MTTSKRFRVAISYASALPERFELVAQVAARLAAAVGGQKHVLYDKFHEAEFSRPDLDEHLIPLYLDQSELMVVFLDEHYERSQWCGLEWRGVRSLIKQRKQSTVMLLRFDATQPQALLGLAGFLDIHGRTAETIASLVLQRWRQETGASDEPLAPAQAEVVLDPPPVVPRQRIEGLRRDALRIFGRERELGDLDAAWAEAGPGKTNVVAFVAAGGAGKTSLVAEWINRLRDVGWHGAEAVFTHSFYSQGVLDRGSASADAFVSDALQFFGDPELAKSDAGPERKGARLAELVGHQRAVLVLDGLEPLQQPPRKGVYAGELKDPAVAALLRGLAHHNRGLCVLTTRVHVHDLRSLGRTVREQSLKQLSKEAAGELLEFLLESNDFKGPAIPSTADERAEIWEAVDGHAFTLQLLGRYLRRRRWDVRRWALIRFEAADASVMCGHAFRMLGAYERWLGGEDGEAMPGGQRMLAVLRILGLFDRAADPGCIGALCEGEAIEGLTEPLVGLDEAEWGDVLADLEGLGLLSRVEWEPARLEGFEKEQTDLDTGETTGEPEVRMMPGWPRLSDELGAHPLVRAHFGRRVRETNEAAWKEGHRRVFEHLCESTPHWPEGEEGLRPLYQAVAHGCQAGEVQKAAGEVYRDRILRGTSDRGFYSTRKLGAFGADLGAVAWLFESPWNRPSPYLPEPARTWLLNEAAFRLRALGRLAEAVGPMRAGLDAAVEQDDWDNAARYAGNLSELELTRGEVAEALRVAEQSVTFADHSSDASQRVSKRTAHADALHQAGRRDRARQRFEEAETMQAEQQPSHPRLYSLGGFRYCDMVLFEAERAAWRVTMVGNIGAPSLASFGGARSSALQGATPHSQAMAECGKVLDRAAQTLEWMTAASQDLLSAALDRLTLGRASLHRALLAAPTCGCQTPTREEHRTADLQREV